MHRRCPLDSLLKSLEWTMRKWVEAEDFADDVSLLAMELEECA